MDPAFISHDNWVERTRGRLSVRHVASWSVVVLLLVALVPASAQTASERTATDLRQSSCRNCHGETGDSLSGGTPRLNGLSADYLRARLESFRYPIKESPRLIHNMGVPAAELSDGVIAALARFYAAQTPFSGAGNGNAQGASIYLKGAKDIPACQDCHGPSGEGRRGAPRLAGQDKGYLQIQLQAFAMAARVSDPMTHHVWFMTPEQAAAVAAYLGN